MAAQVDIYHRLESRRGDRDLNNGFAARVHDPLWFLARQWQMGEHQGENASTPVRIECVVSQTPIAPLGGNPAFNPKFVPAEALVESELEDWWTMGRRIRVGARLAANAALGLASNPAVQFKNPPPPYEAFAGKVDGRAAWLARQKLGLPDASFGTDVPPLDSPDFWNSARLCYNATFNSPAGELQISNHRGGALDWYSADSRENSGVGAGPPPVNPVLVPTPLEYRGAPHSRFWEIEDSKVDIGGYAPDTAHFPTMLLVELIYSHSDDWFLFPVQVDSGSIVTIRQITVTDSFGEKYDSTEKLAGGAARYPGLSAPSDFSIYSCVGLAPESLVVWPVAEGPLESAAIERVQFGVDEQSNVLWALERIINSRQAARGPQTPDAAHPVYPPAKPSGDLTKAKTYAYKPAQGIETYWHPYRLELGRARRARLRAVGPCGLFAAKAKADAASGGKSAVWRHAGGAEAAQHLCRRDDRRRAGAGATLEAGARRQRQAGAVGRAAAAYPARGACEEYAV